MLVYFSFNATATTEIYTLSLHDALPICQIGLRTRLTAPLDSTSTPQPTGISEVSNNWSGTTRKNRFAQRDRKSTRLNSSHPSISYAVFCLKKKKTNSTAHDRFIHHHDIF